MPETTFKIEVITPERTVLSDTANWVIVPGEAGEFQVLPGHTPMLTGLGTGLVTVDRGGTRKYISVSGGFCEVMPERLLILARMAELPETIDRDRARASRDRALTRLAQRDSSNIDLDRARRSLARAEIRLRLADMQ